MIDPLTGLLIAGGGYVAYKEITDDKKSPSEAGSLAAAEENRSNPLGGKTRREILMEKMRVTGVFNPLASSSQSAYYRPSEIPREIEDQIFEKAKAEFDKLTGDAKKKACAELKKQFPEQSNIQGLSCDANFEEVYRAIVAALGAGAYAAGTATCGPPCGALASIVTVYIGASVENWVTDAYNRLGDLKDDTENLVKDKLGDAGDAIRDGLSSLNPF